MARWTATMQDIRHISRIAGELPMGGLVLVMLKNKSFVEGVLVRGHMSNNGGQGGWKFCGELDLLTKSSKLVTIDYLDIDHATSAWNEATAREYEALGLITIVEYPTS